MGLRIAIGEDDPQTRQFLANALRRMGHQVTVAGNGRELIRCVRADWPDVVVTDVIMPQLDGLSALRQLWQERALPAVVVAATERVAEPELADLPYLMAWLVKPVRSADLSWAVLLANAQFRRLNAAARTLRCVWTAFCRAGADRDWSPSGLRPDAAEHGLWQPWMDACLKRFGCHVSELLAAMRLAEVIVEREGGVLDEVVAAAIELLFAHGHDGALFQEVLKNVMNSDCH